MVTCYFAWCQLTRTHGQEEVMKCGFWGWCEVVCLVLVCFLFGWESLIEI